MDNIFSDSSSGIIDSGSLPSPGSSISSSSSGTTEFKSNSISQDTNNLNLNSPWKSNVTTENKTSFADLMSEDLAKDLQQREEEELFDPPENINLEDFKLESEVDTSNDLLLAQYLQYEYDKQHDSQLKREEQHYNKNSKVSVSLNKFKACPLWYGEESDEEYLDDDDERVLDSFEERQRLDPVIGSKGYTRQGDRMVTKHDPQISGRKNAERIMNLPPGINTGDGGGFDMNLSNKVFNKLHRSAMNEVRRKQRYHDKEEKATTDLALDSTTKLLLFKMLNNDVLEEVHGTISTGKESVILHVNGGRYEDLELPSECVVKVFKTTLTDFKTREKYIREDYRFKDRLSKNNTRTMIQWWCEKEYHNLRRLQRASIPSPRPILIKKHLLVMSFIGDEHQAAPKLKDVQLSFADWCIAYEEIESVMIKMFQGCHLVHADLSEYNILWHQDHCVFIDLGQAVEPTHPHALEFLYRDCSNIIRFFTSKRIPNLPKPSELFTKITGIELYGPEEDAIDRIKEYESSQERWQEGIRNQSDQFDFLWNEIKTSEKRHKQKCSKFNEDNDDEFVAEFISKDSDSECTLSKAMTKVSIDDNAQTRQKLGASKKKSVQFDCTKNLSHIPPSTPQQPEEITPEEQAIYDKITEAKKKAAIKHQNKKKRNKKTRTHSASSN